MGEIRGEIALDLFAFFVLIHPTITVDDGDIFFTLRQNCQCCLRMSWDNFQLFLCQHLMELSKLGRLFRTRAKLKEIVGLRINFPAIEKSISYPTEMKV